jgi:TPR repeat protein
MDRAEAAKWYRRAAEQGERSVGLGQRDLGRLYEKGWGVPKALHPLRLTNFRHKHV